MHGPHHNHTLKLHEAKVVLCCMLAFTESRGCAGHLVSLGEGWEVPLLHLSLHLLPTLEDVSYHVVAREQRPVGGGQREAWSHSVLGVVPLPCLGRQPLDGGGRAAGELGWTRDEVGL